MPEHDSNDDWPFDNLDAGGGCLLTPGAMESVADLRLWSVLGDDADHPDGEYRRACDQTDD